MQCSIIIITYYVIMFINYLRSHQFSGLTTSKLLATALKRSRDNATPTVRINSNKYIRNDAIDGDTCHKETCVQDIMCELLFIAVNGYHTRVIQHLGRNEPKK